MRSSKVRTVSQTNALANHRKGFMNKLLSTNYRARLVALLIVLSVAAVGYSAIMTRRVGAAPQSAPVSPLGAGPVTVTATAGTTGPTDYNTVGEAFTAINAGTHQGAITIDIVANTTETAANVLNSSGAGSALYTSVLMRPINDGVTIAGPTVTGRGLIELNGADNVTIDGDNPNSMGTNRNLTIQNTAASTITFTQVIRIALNTTTVTSADNNIFRNLNLLGSATGRNAAANTATGGTQENTYGILATASASGAATAPTAISSLTTVIATGATATNLTIQNNFINTAARAVAVQGSAATVFPGLLIENNLIGNATAGATDQVYQMGVTAQGTNNAIVRGNTVYIESFLGSAVRGLEFGSISATGTTALFEKNKVLRVRNNNVGTFGSYGINLGGGNTHTVQNNFVADVRNDQTAGTGAFSTTFGAFGIRVGAGTGHKVYHNSVHLFGVMPGVTSTNLVAAFGIAATGQTGCDVRNNIFSNQLTGGNPAGTRFVPVFLPSGATVAMNLTINNNGYYQGTSAQSRLAQVGTTFGTGEYLAANFNPGATTPATNFRAYTSPLSAAGTNDNASFATTNPPPFTSNTDLHIPNGTVTLLESGGAPVGVTVDIDNETRNATTPDIGADEFTGVLPPANDIAATAIIVPVNGSTVLNGGTVTPQASFTNVGTATQMNVMVTFTITGPGGFNYTDTQTIATITPGQTVTVTFAATAALTANGTYNTTAAVTTMDANAANDTVNGTFIVASPLAGTITVGSGGNYPSLTNPGGAFQTINSLGATANITIEITSDLTGETGAVALNEIAGGFTVLIKPTGAARAISGTSAAFMIPINGADGVTIDGSLSAGTDRSLTITNTGGGGVIGFTTGTNGAQNNVVKNLIVRGGSPTVTLIGIAFGGNTFGSAGTDNDNNRVENNDIGASVYGVYSVGLSAANPNTGVVITRNQMTGTGALRIGRIGIFTGNDNGVQITENNIDGISSAENADAIGIAAGSQALATTPPAAVSQVNALISRNRIGLVQQTNTFSAAGIVLGSGTTGTNTVVNNMISGVIANANAGDIVAGMYIIPAAGATQNIYHNSVSMTGARGATADQFGSFALAVTADQATNITNNILLNTQTATGTDANSYAIGFNAATFANITSNFNDLFVSGPQGTNLAITGGFRATTAAPTPGTGTNRVDLAAYQAASGEDANSLSVNPLFVSTTDLHLQAGSPAINTGTTGTGVTVDFDGQTRDATPDMGADEFIVLVPGTLNLSAATYTVGEAAGTVTITVNRTGGTDGAVAVNYALTDGTAVGGATCTTGIDYINTGGTVNFTNGQASNTFTVTICNDSLNEASETFTVTLSGATGGATIGTQASAVVTITDDDAVPTIAITSPSPAPEGNAGTTTLTFNVNLSAASGQTITVQYQTADNTATVADNDYVAIPLTTLTFLPGETNKQINVTVNGDTTVEPDETFFVNLSNPTNATISTAQGTGTILNDDALVGTVSINDVRTLEGDSGTHTVTFTATLTTPSTPPANATVQYATGGGTATPGVDYQAASGTLNFGMPLRTDNTDGGPVITTRTFTVTINGDLTKEANETFFVTLSNAVGIGIADAQGVGIIIDDDRAYTGDFDDDRQTDFTVFRPSDGYWYTLQSTNNVTTFRNFGTNGDRPVPGDYDGDSVTDLAVFRPSTATWYIEQSSNFGFVQAQFGISTDKAVQGDYDGDGKTDIAVFRDGAWYVLQSSTSATTAVSFGTTGDIPVQGDYDGDAKTDYAVFRNGTWYVLKSSDGGLLTQNFGVGSDKAVPADYDGDGKYDFAVFRDGTWYVLESLSGNVRTVSFGTSGDIPVMADYDADGTTDIAVFRPSNGTWYALRSSDNTSLTQQWGQNGDVPVPSAYLAQ